MKSLQTALLLLSLISPVTLRATEISPSPAATNSAPVTPPKSTPAPASPATIPSPSPTPSPLLPRQIADIHATILLPKEWTLLPGKLMEGDVLLATREKVVTASDPWTTGLSMTIDRNGAKDSGQKASDYAMGLAREANAKAGDEATPIKESQTGPFHEARFDFTVPDDPPLLVTEVREPMTPPALSP